eukprot:CAMPEP_0119285788 /NCGR_PEP_ID=MMETSP1329-20130426/32863_1 /TAXON_ID=114041 /ORGANISM="Genus nov. species nov., Strain RCC1024" /LENGTH=54 /DNA_ID=CAMNT_0007286507 /DNA_START=80 /DNA_END=240 /DNA_ORIENTATION=+
MARPSSDANQRVRTPDATQRMRLVEDTAEDEMAWSDEARTQIGVQVTALLLASA